MMEMGEMRYSLVVPCLACRFCQKDFFCDRVEWTVDATLFRVMPSSLCSVDEKSLFLFCETEVPRIMPCLALPCNTMPCHAEERERELHAMFSVSKKQKSTVMENHGGVKKKGKMCERKKKDSNRVGKQPEPFGRSLKNLQ